MKFNLPKINLVTAVLTTVAVLFTVPTLSKEFISTTTEKQVTASYNKQVECLASVDALTPKLSDTDRFYIEQLEEQYSRRISRVQYQRDLHDRLARCLYQFGDPDIRELLDAEDHETLRRMTQVLDRLSA